MAVKRIRLVILVVVVAGLIAAAVTLPAVPRLVRLFEYIGSLGPWGPIVLGVFYVVSCVLLIPASVPTIAAGFLFGAFTGSVTATVGGTAGACAAFWIIRTVARGWVVERVARSRRFTSLDNALDEQGLKIVILARLSPIAPFAIVNYMLGLTKVSFWKYVLGTVLGVTPGMVLYAYFGAGLRSLAEVTAYARGQTQTTAIQQAFFWLGLVVTVVVTVLLTRIARRALGAAAPEDLDETTDER
jgi:uncharacterized membrane protein YdjX (TVP38/TMEM64 family)